MKRQSDLERELASRLQDESLPGEGEARERTWETVRAAQAELTSRPVTRRHRRGLIAGALAAGSIALVALTRVYVGVMFPVRAMAPNNISAIPLPSMCAPSVTTLPVRAG